jgi:protein TonB
MGLFKETQDLQGRHRGHPGLGLAMSVLIHGTSVALLVGLSTTQMLPTGSPSGEPIDFAVIPQGTPPSEAPTTPTSATFAANTAPAVTVKAVSKPATLPSKVEPKADVAPVAALPEKVAPSFADAPGPDETSPDLIPVVEKVDASASVSEEATEVVPSEPVIVAKTPDTSGEAPTSAPAETGPMVAPTTESKSELPAAAPSAPAAQGGSLAGSSGTPSLGQVRSVSDLRQRPGNRAPQYPDLSRRNSEQGSGQLLYYITREGSVRDVKVIRSTGHPRLDQEAVRAIAEYRFFPGQEGWTTHAVNFSLRGGAEDAPSRLRTGPITTSQREDARGELRTRTN